VDLATLAGVTRITGDLSLEPQGLMTVELPSLQRVDGQLNLGSNSSLTTISFPALTQVGGQLNLPSNTALTTLNLEALASVGNRFFLTGVPALENFSAPLLETIGGTLMVWGADALETLAFPRLSSVAGAITVEQAAALKALSFPVLSTAAGLTIGSLPQLTELGAPQLATVSGTLFLGNALAPTTLDFSSLISATGLRIEGTKLASLAALSGVTSVGTDGLQMSNNTMLTEALLPALVDIQGQILLNNNTVLTTLSLPEVTQAPSVRIFSSIALSTLSLPKLARVTHDLTIQNTALTTFAVPVTSAGYITVTDNGSLTELTFPFTSKVTTVQIASNAVLETVRFPEITTIACNLVVANAYPTDCVGNSMRDVEYAIYINSPSVKTVSLPALTTVGGQVRLASGALTTLEIDQLTSVNRLTAGSLPFSSWTLPNLTSGAISIGYMPQLTNFSAPVLASTQYLELINTPLLTSVSVPLLQAADSHLTVEGTGLSDLSGFPSFNSAGWYLHVIRNPNLPACAAINFAAQVTAPSKYLSQNTGTGTCAPEA
jgi:hypothetical protein